MPEQISTAVSQIKGGTVKALATLGPELAPGLEELPTTESQGMKELDCGAWGSFSFPKGTNQSIVQRMAKLSSDTIDTPMVRDRFKTLGVTVAAPNRRSPEYMKKFVVSEMERWGKPIKASGVSIE